MSHKHFIQLLLGNKSFGPTRVSTEDCEYVDDFKEEIKKKFSPDLDSYPTHRLTLYEADGTTEIDPETSIGELREIPWKPMIVKVEEVELPALITLSRRKGKQQKEMSVEASCRKYFDALAKSLTSYYNFNWGRDSSNDFPTIGDVIRAKNGKAEWDYIYKLQEPDNAGFTTVGQNSKPAQVAKMDIPLPDLFSKDEWDTLEKMNHITTLKIHDADLPKTLSGKKYIILAKKDYDDAKIVSFFKKIGVKGRLFVEEDDLVIKNADSKSSSSGSEDSLNASIVATA